MSRRIILVISIVVAAITLGAFLLFRPHKTVSSDPDYTAAETTTSLYCHTNDGLESPLFEDYQASSHRHEIEAIFYNDRLHDVSYTFTGQYIDQASAVDAEAHVHADVNLKLATLNLQESSINHNYSIRDSELIVRITATENTLNEDTAPMVLLVNPTNPNDTMPQDLTAVKTAYISQGFVCQQNNNK